MVDGRHLEQTLAVGQLEVANLQDDGQGLQDVDDAHEDQDQGQIQRKGQSTDHAAQEQGASVAHEDLGRMPVVEQVSDQTAHQCSGNNSQIQTAHGNGGSGEEHHDRDGDGTAQTVNAVGQVDSIVTADHDEHGEEDVDHGMQGQGHIDEGDVQIAGHDAQAVQHIQVQSGHGHLQHSLLQRGQAQVALLHQLGVVIQEADEAVAQGNQQRKQGGIVLHKGDVANNTDNRGQNEHQAAHHGGAGLHIVPGGTDLTNGLTGLQCPQNGQQDVADDAGEDQAHQGGDQDASHKYKSSVFSILFYVYITS